MVLDHVSERVSRRGFLAGAFATGLVGNARAGEIFVISRDRVLREASPARRLGAAEAQMTKQLQALVDKTKADLADEEVELTRLRSELPTEEFDNRVADFDRRIRTARRLTQERASVLQKAFQEARSQVVALLPEVVERLRVETGASMILNADQVLAADPATDLTDRAIALLEERGTEIPIPVVDLMAPLFGQTATAPENQ